MSSTGSEWQGNGDLEAAARRATAGPIAPEIGSLTMADMTSLRAALAVRAISAETPEQRHGAALAVLRSDALIGTYDDHPAARHAQAIYDEIMAVTVSDMPASQDHVAILLEAAAQRAGGLSWAHVWRSIGVSPATGRGYTSGRSNVEWPVFYTLRSVAFG